MAHLKCSVEKKQNCELLTLLKSVWVFTSLQNGDTDIFSTLVRMILGLPSWCSGKESACQCRRLGFDPWVGKILWRKWQPTPVLLPGKSHGQRSLVSYSPWGSRVGHDRAHTYVQVCAWLSLAGIFFLYCLCLVLGSSLY